MSPGEFHLELARIHGNRRLYDVLEDLIASSSLISGLYEKSNDFLDTIDEHASIFSAIKDKEFDRLPQLMEEHMRSIETKLLMRYEEEQLPELEAVFA